MSRLRTLIAGALIMTGLSGVARADDDLVLVFAGCTGRLSAEMEFAWLVNDARADQFQAQRQRFESILEAVMPPDRGRETLSHRIEAKFAHAAILNAARFGTDPRLSKMAKKQARLNLQSCQNMLLDG